MSTTLLGRKGPIVLVFVFAAVAFLGFFLPEIPQFEFTVSGTTNIMTTVVAFTFFIAVINFFALNWRRTKRKETGEWPYAVYSMVLFFVYVILGLLPGYTIQQHPFFLSFYNLVHFPVAKAMLGILAFNVIEGGIRAFRVRTFEAACMVLSAMFVLYTTAPIGEMISPLIPAIGNWTVSVPQLAGNRGVLISFAIGAVALTFRQMIGMEKAAYLGEGE